MDTDFEALRAPNARAVREAVDRFAGHLEKGKLSGEDVGTLAEQFVLLSRHPRWEVRKAVAHATRVLHHDVAHEVLSRLVGDDNALVREAAEKSRARHEERRDLDFLKEQHAEQFERWLAELEAKHGRPARDAAIEAAKRYAELLVREASHELAQPIKAAGDALENIAEALAATTLDRDAAVARLTRARNRVRFIGEILGSLREFSRRSAPSFARHSLRAIVKEAVAVVREGADEKWDVKVQVAIDRALVLQADRGHLVQAFRNLVQNACESFEKTPRPHRIRIAARPARGSLVVTITDNGCGMSEDMRLGAFRLFVTSKPVGVGTGFGLPFAKKVVESMHGGSIALASARGKGTTVTVTLPRTQEKRS